MALLDRRTELRSAGIDGIVQRSGKLKVLIVSRLDHESHKRLLRAELPARLSRLHDATNQGVTWLLVARTEVDEADGGSVLPRRGQRAGP